MSDVLAIEKAYLVANQVALAADHPSKFLLIKGEAVHGAFETYEEGVIAGIKKFSAGPFLVRLISRPEDSEAPNIPALSLGFELVTKPTPAAPRPAPYQ